MKRFFRKNLLIDVYIIVSVIAALISLPASNLAMALFTLGASSGYIAFGIFCGATVDIWVGLLALVWCMGFPIALMISYIIAIKKNYTPILVMCALDAIVVVIWCTYMLMSNDMYAFSAFVPDAIVSVAYSALLIRLFK